MASVLEYLQGRGQVFTVIPRPRNADAGEAKPDARIPAGLVARTVVAIGKEGLAVLVIPASRRLELALVVDVLGDPDARLATEEELERQFPDYDPGAVPPLSMLLLAPMYVDPAVIERGEIVFAAGRQDVSVRMSTSDLFGNDPVVVTPLTRQSRIGAHS